MPSDDSIDDEFLRNSEDSTRQPSNLIALNPLPNDDEINRSRNRVSGSGGGLSHSYDYNHSFQSDPTATWSSTAQENALTGIGSQRSNLGNLLSRAMEPHFEEESKRWLPESELLQLCKPENILEELKLTFSPGDAFELFHYVCGNPHQHAETDRSACKIFSILLLINEPKELRRFFRCGYCDKDLPFTWSKLGNRRKILRPLNQPFTGNQDIEHETCFQEGEDRFMNNFYREQWQVHIPFISRTENNQVAEYELHHDTIMPWKSHQDVEQHGGFSKVYKIQIHPAHHSFEGHDTFALKVLRSTDPNALERELYALRKTSPGPHVIELLATFKRGSELSFLFPWAEGGNLANLMSEEPFDVLHSTNNSSGAFIEWLAEQGAGLAMGLRGIHKVETKVNDPSSNGQGRKDDYGIHGDVKPENILRFLDKGKGVGKLKLSDFGLTRFHTIASRSNQHWEGPISPTYASPEHTRDCFHVSRKSDVWALGCVFSMLLTWAIRGPDALKAYGDARHDEPDPGRKVNWLQDTFYGTKYTEDGKPLIPGGFFLKTAVHECIEMNKNAILGPDRKCNYLTEFLDFIRDKMLQIHSSERATSKEVCEFLNKKMQEYKDTHPSITLPTLNRP
ncbi:hypothetical protein CEP53_003168 [Fusarium sp. AF-6]|nr:hypothetical protein CEP53_003168 [Fusarium sp. AF-6]